jgi:hypothetical protein
MSNILKLLKNILKFSLANHKKKKTYDGTKVPEGIQLPIPGLG